MWKRVTNILLLRGKPLPERTIASAWMRVTPAIPITSMIPPHMTANIGLWRIIRPKMPIKDIAVTCLAIEEI